jgi:DNA-binding LytR/AlgR family response regulator
MLTSNADTHTFNLVDGTINECPIGGLDLEQTLVSKGFISLRNGVLINLNRIEKIDKRGNGSIIMEGNISVPLDVQNKDKLIEQLEKLSMKGNG